MSKRYPKDDFEMKVWNILNDYRQYRLTADTGPKAMMELLDETIMNELLKLYDWHIRIIGDGNSEDADDNYSYGYVDGIGQCIINISQALGAHQWNVEKQEYDTGYKFEAYKRCMEYDTTKNYWKKYPKPLASYFPVEEIRKNGGKL